MADEDREEGPMSDMIKDPAGHLLAVERKREPFELAALFICWLSGMTGSLWYDTLADDSIRAYPGVGGRVFLALMVVGSGTALIGVFQRSLTGMRLERAGLWLLVSLCLSFTVWTPFAVGWEGLGMVLFFGLLVAGPGFYVARRLTRLIDAVELAINDRQEGAGDAQR